MDSRRASATRSLRCPEDHLFREPLEMFHRGRPVLMAIRPLLEDAAFIASTPGCFLNRISNRNDDSGNPVRLTYYTIDPGRSLNAVRDFVNAVTELAIFESKDSNRPNANDALGVCSSDELRFRNFLNRNSLVADQLGHTLDVNQNVYTVPDLSHRRAAVNLLETALQNA
jgi:hypothetical protein